MTVAKLISICLYAAIGIFTVYLSSFVRTKDNLTAYEKALNKTYITGIFLVLFLCSAMRFEVGNDYTQYVYTAHEASVGGYVVTEIGFNALVSFIYQLFGGEYYEIVFAVFAFSTIAVFLHAMYEQSVCFHASFFLFITLGLYFQTFNTVRYYFALSIALYCMKYVLEKDYIRFIFWILVAALFHKSVLIVIPIYIIATFTWKKWQIIVGFLLSGVCYLLKKPLLLLALKLYPSYRDTIYLEGGISLYSILRTLLAIGFYDWFSRKYPEENNPKIRFYVQLNMLALVVSTFFSFLPVVTRIAYYFSISQLLMIPAILLAIPEKKVRINTRAIVFITCVFYFSVFLYTADRPGVGLLPYKTWIFNDVRYICK